MSERPRRAVRLRSALVGLGLSAVAATALPTCVPQAHAQAPAAAPSSLGADGGAGTGKPSAALIEERARAAAERILEALRSGDAAARYAQFAPELQRMTSPALIENQIRRMPQLLSWTISQVAPGLDSSTVEARLATSAGPRDLVMVIDENGKLDGFHFNASDQPAETVARNFVQALSQGRFVYAEGFLSPDLQAEIPASSLQGKWLNLQRLTGNFVRIRRVFRSEHTPDMKLVLVNTEFNRLTDNLFVILDKANTIIGVDFPTKPQPQAPPR